jgi:hypothetical protein
MPNFHGRLVNGETYDRLCEEQGEAYEREFARLLAEDKAEWEEEFGDWLPFKPNLQRIHELAVAATEPHYEH